MSKCAIAYRRDPTRDEMLAFLRSQGCEDDGDAIEAIWWFGCFYHGGMWSNLYSALSTSPYRPSPIAEGPDDPYWYDALVHEYRKG